MGSGMSVWSVGSIRNSTANRLIDAHISDPGNDLVGHGEAPLNEVVAARVVVGPEVQAALSQEVFVVEAEFFEAGARHVGQLELHLFGRAARDAALGDVLHAGSCSLHHLVVGAAAQADVSVAEAYREIIDKLRHDEALQVAVASVGRKQGLWFMSVARGHVQLEPWTSNGGRRRRR